MKSTWLTQTRDGVVSFVRITDWTQVVIIAALCVIGYFSILSSGALRESDFHQQQLVFMIIGWMAYWAVSVLDYREIRRGFTSAAFYYSSRFFSVRFLRLI